MLHNRVDHHFIDGLFRVVIYCALHVCDGGVFRLALDSPPSARAEVFLLLVHILPIKLASHKNLFHQRRKKVAICVQGTHNLDWTRALVLNLFCSNTTERIYSLLWEPPLHYGEPPAPFQTAPLLFHLGANAPEAPLLLTDSKHPCP